MTTARAYRRHLGAVADRGIDPIGGDDAPTSIHTEQRRVVAMSGPAEVLDGIDAEDPTDSASTETSDVSPVQPDEPADTASIDDVQQVQSDEGAPSLSGAEPEDSEPTVSGDQDTPPEPGRRLEGSAARRADLLRTVRALSSASKDASGSGEPKPNESEPEERDDAER